MDQATSTTPAKATRNRAFIRSYDYDTGKGTVKDAVAGKAVVEFDINSFPQTVKDKLALAHAMSLVAAAGVEAARDGEDGAKAMTEAITDLAADKVEFRDGVGIAMGGTLKRVGRALVDLGKAYVANVDGTKLSWDKARAEAEGFTYVGAEGIEGAFRAMKTLWDTPESVKGAEPKYESGRSRFNKVKALPEVAAKLATYSKKATTAEVG